MEAQGRSVPAQSVYDYLLQNYPPSVLGWVNGEQWQYLPNVSLDSIKMARRPGGRDQKKVEGITQAVRDRKPMEPVVLVQTADGFKVADGYHRTLAFQHAGLEHIGAWVAVGTHDAGPWDRDMHDAKLNVSMSVLDSTVERLAALEHDQWVYWSKGVAHEVNPERRERWAKLWVPYSQLSEEEKDKDREWARKAIAIAKGVSITEQTMSIEERLSFQEQVIFALVKNQIRMESQMATPNPGGGRKKGYPTAKSEYGDPQDNAYPLDTEAHVRDAKSRFEEYKSRYSKKKREEILRNIDEAEKRMKIGKYRESASAGAPTDLQHAAMEEVMSIVKSSLAVDDEEMMAGFVQEMLQSQINHKTSPEQQWADEFVGDFMRQVRQEGWGRRGP